MRSLIVGIAVALTAWGQCLPVSANQRKVKYAVAGDGTRTLLTEEFGVFKEAANCSTYSTTQRIVNGAPAGDLTVVLRDAVTGKVYHIHPARRVAEVSAERVNLTPRVRRSDGEPKVIQGILCHPLPVRYNGAVVGTTWVDLQHDLEIQADFTITSGGTTTAFHVEKTGVEYGVDPDPTLFRVPAGFEVLQALKN